MTYVNPFEKLDKAPILFQLNRVEFIKNLPKDVLINFQLFEKNTSESIGLLIKNIQPDGLFLKLVNDSENAKASKIWNSSYVLDYLSRSQLFNELNNTYLKESIIHLFKINPLNQFFYDSRSDILLAFPRSFPHLIQLYFFYYDYSVSKGNKILDFVLQTYSKDNFLFYEAEYVSLQLLSTLLYLAKKDKFLDQRQSIIHYFDQILPVIDGIVERNNNYYCNEQFEKKYNILLLSFLTDLSIFYESIHPICVFKNPQINHLKKRILKPIFDQLRSCLKETEYLLYFIKTISSHLSINNEWRYNFINDLWIELSSRKQDGLGFTVTMDGGPSFNFHLSLNLYTYEFLFHNK